MRLTRSSIFCLFCLATKDRGDPCDLGTELEYASFQVSRRNVYFSPHFQSATSLAALWLCFLGYCSFDSKFPPRLDTSSTICADTRVYADILECCMETMRIYNEIVCIFVKEMLGMLFCSSVVLTNFKSVSIANAAPRPTATRLPSCTNVDSNSAVSIVSGVDASLSLRRQQG